ncbi:MAG: veratrol--corrinoid protein metyltransferase [Spirochaetaceae bacterium]|nr:veratrol--corrinoid protein metyltransferase [Spirochaetaceae bacterium]
MAALTPKENYLRVGRGEIPEWVPAFMPYKDHGPATAVAGPFVITSGQAEMITGWQQPHGDWKDMWGANYTFEAGMNAGLPKPNAFILDDVSKWEQVIKHPAVPQHDWAAMAKAELDKIDRTQTAVAAELGFQPFQQLVAFMGFTEALVALYEDPGSCIDLLNYMADWYVPRIETTLDYWKPDVMTMGDDTAAQANPFFSIDVYRSVFKPIYARITKPVKERGVLINFHNCGRSEDFVGEMIDVGANYWNPCQEENDLTAVQKKYGSKIALTGGWKYNIKLDDTESTVRGFVREYLDTYAKNGGFIAMAFAGDFTAGPEGFAKWAPVNGWINDEIYEYGTAIYRGRF